ncbi:HEL066Cp [Eremothecium sinecaudum]|uniref:HEL066Cp n=1 Tax=Eremothecium sinecaudum TaxID=45286 RepID=A0A0X8HTK7_9SACH|nr:HEL066Cp [Eremothecium sinecaudum]AMD21214.1 HEL066Cp [Eremothecium sinecaudum]
MSFDWLTIPGLQVDSESQESSERPPPPIPNLSFNFNEDSNSIGNDTRHPSEQSDSVEGENPPPLPSRSHLQAEVMHESSSMNSLYDSKKANNNINANNSDTQLVAYTETKEDMMVPLSLSSSMLDEQEYKTYKRWYNMLVSKRRGQNIQLDHIFSFLGNFHLTDLIKERVRYIFRSCQHSVNIAQFFAIMRVISHSLHDSRLPTRQNIVEKAPVPTPRSILSSEAGHETYEEVEADPRSEIDNKVDFDSFASLLLTGKSVRKNIRRKINKKSGKVKKVAFSDNLVTFHEEYRLEDEGIYGDFKEVEDNNEEDSETAGPLDYSLPMEKLLKKLSARKHHNSALVSEPAPQPETAEEREVLADMHDSLNRFKQIQTVDNVTLGDFSSQFRAYIAGTHSDSTSSDPQVEEIATDVNEKNGMYSPSQRPIQVQRQQQSSQQSSQQQQLNSSPFPPPPVAQQYPQQAPTSYQSHYSMQPPEYAQHSSQATPVNSSRSPEPRMPFMQDHKEEERPAAHTTVLEPLRPTATGSANRLFRSQMESIMPINAKLPAAQPPVQPPSRQVPEITVMRPTTESSSDSKQYTMHPQYPPMQSQPTPLLSSNSAVSTPSLTVQDVDYIPSRPYQQRSPYQLQSSPQTPVRTLNSSPYHLSPSHTGIVSSGPQPGKYFRHNITPSDLSPQHNALATYQPPSVQQSAYLMTRKQPQYNQIQQPMQSTSLLSVPPEKTYNSSYLAPNQAYSRQQLPQQNTLQFQGRTLPPSYSQTPGYLNDLKALQDQVNEIHRSYNRR